MRGVRFPEGADAIIRAEVRKTPENIMAACCRAAAKIYNSPSLATLGYTEARKNKYVWRIVARWYSVTSKEKVCFAMFCRQKTFINRKVEARGTKVAIAPVQTPAPLRGSFKLLQDYLNNR